MQEAFHERLKRLREAKGWNPSKLAKKSQMNESSIVALETDSRHAPSWIAISKLASALKTNPIFLASGEGNDKPFHVPPVHWADATASARRH
jgi:transcriptional regulator with XRE-family HTH domain